MRGTRSHPCSLEGDPEVVAEEAVSLSESAATLKKVRTMLHLAEAGRGSHCDALTATFHNAEFVVTSLTVAAERYTAAGEALARYATVLEAAQQVAAVARAEFDDASAEVEEARAHAPYRGRGRHRAAEPDDAEVASYERWREVGEAAALRRDAALQQFREAEADVRRAGDQAAAAIEDVVAGSRLNDSLLDDAAGMAGDAWDGLVGFADGVAELVEQIDHAVSALILANLLAYSAGLGDNRLRPTGPGNHSTAAADAYRTSSTVRMRVRQEAMLAGDVYADTAGDLPAGWTRLSEPRLRARGIDPASLRGADGFFAAVYRGPNGRHVVAFRGSESPVGNAGDWSTNARNASGLETSQGRAAVRLGQDVTAALPPGTVSFAGHSLGGSLAATASIATGEPATTFNAAGVGDGNWERAAEAHGPGATDGHVTNYRTTNDIVTLAQERTLAVPAAGEQVTITSSAENPAAGHGLGAFEWDEPVPVGR